MDFSVNSHCFIGLNDQKILRFEAGSPTRGPAQINMHNPGHDPRVTSDVEQIRAVAGDLTGTSCVLLWASRKRGCGLQLQSRTTNLDFTSREQVRTHGLLWMTAHHTSGGHARKPSSDGRHCRGAETQEMGTPEGSDVHSWLCLRTPL